MNAHRIFAAFLLLLSPLAFPDDPQIKLSTENGKPVLLVQNPQGKVEVYRDLLVLKAGTPLYHWGPADQVEHWVRQGRVAEAEVNKNASHGNGAIGGGGTYFSTDPLDTHSYGDRLAVAILPRDAIFVRSKIYIAGRFINTIKAGILNAGISGFSNGIDPQKLTWINIGAPQDLVKVRAPEASDFSNRKLWDGDAKIWRKDRESISKNYPEIAQALEPVFSCSRKGLLDLLLGK